MYYGDGKKKTAGLNELRDLDVLLTTPHMNMPGGEVALGACARRRRCQPAASPCLRPPTPPTNAEAC